MSTLPLAQSSQPYSLTSRISEERAVHPRGNRRGTWVPFWAASTWPPLRSLPFCALPSAPGADLCWPHQPSFWVVPIPWGVANGEALAGDGGRRRVAWAGCLQPLAVPATISDPVSWTLPSQSPHSSSPEGLGGSAPATTSSGGLHVVVPYTHPHLESSQGKCHLFPAASPLIHQAASQQLRTSSHKCS